jgi:hypothetical protein
MYPCLQYVRVKDLMRKQAARRPTPLPCQPTEAARIEHAPYLAAQISVFAAIQKIFCSLSASLVQCQIVCAR